MKKIHIVLILLLFVLTNTAQEFSGTNNYLFNEYSINPAFVGNNKIAAYTNIKNQWTSLEGAPKYRELGGYGSLMDNAYIGGKISSYTIGITRNTVFTGTYTYNATMTEYSGVGFSVWGQAVSRKIDEAKIEVFDDDDPTITNSNMKNTYMRAGAGMHYWYDIYFVDVFTPFFFDENGKMFMNIAFMAGVKRNVGDFTIYPAIKSHYTESKEFITYVTVAGSYKKTVHLYCVAKTNKYGVVGLGYTYKNILSILLNYEFSVYGKSTIDHSSYETSFMYNRASSLNKE